MLPPVRTTSGSSGSYQNSSSVLASGHLAGEPIFPGQAADADRDVNPNLAGKLNVLLLSGRDTVAEGLSLLADSLGRAIGMPRRGGEGGADYVLRLALALSSLNPQQRAEAERQLALLVRGIRLQLVINAFLNPSGPEAARVVALLEMANSKERDLATRTVLTSYQQNEGAELALEMNGFRPVSTVASGAGAAMEGASPHKPEPPVNATSASLLAPINEGEDVPPNAPAAPAEGPQVGDMPLIDAEEFEDEPELVIFHQETDNIFSRTSVRPLSDQEPSQTSRGSSARYKPGDERAAQTPDQASSRPTAPRIADARSLQSVLETAFAQGENSDPVIQAKAAMQLLAGDEPQHGTRLLPSARRDFIAKPFIDYTRPPPRPLTSSEPFSALMTLKGWSEGEISGLTLLSASSEAEATLAAALSPHAGPEPDIGSQGLQLRGRGTAANDTTHKTALSAAEQQLLRNADEAAGLAADRRLDLQVQRELSTTEALLTSALKLSQDLRLAIPYTQHPYPVASEAEDSGRDRSGFRSSSDEGSSGDEDEGASPDENSEDGFVAEAVTEEVLEDATPAASVADPAYDLYQRMAGWN